MPGTEHYVQSALTGYKVWLESAFVLTLDDALARVRAIPSRESVYAPGRRLALPDEVLILNRANDHERALLLYALLRLSEPFSGAHPDELALRMEGQAWRVELRDRALVGAEL